MARPLYIAGDVHLNGSPNAFDGWLDTLAAQPLPGHLVILGDLFDYWLDTARMRARYADSLARLRRLRDQGWDLDFVLGNREMGGGSRLRIATGCQVHWPGLDIRRGEQVIRIVHGDRLCHDPGYHFLHAVLTSFWVRVAIWTTPGAVQEWVGSRIRRSSRGNRHRLEQAATPRRIGASRDMLDERRVRASARGADVLIAGHIHERTRMDIVGVDLLLVGEWSADTGSWVEVDGDGTLRQLSL